ncbi:MAG: hypothetical protein PHC92_11840 [Syntrophomonadaceae bacterium]|nr:hypothetical protein [Syntrophomonadaceae bacterium]
MLVIAMKLAYLSLRGAQRLPVIASAARQSSPVIDYVNENRLTLFVYRGGLNTRENCEHSANLSLRAQRGNLPPVIDYVNENRLTLFVYRGGLNTRENCERSEAIYST